MSWSCREPTEKWWVWRGPICVPQHILGSSHPTQHWRWSLSAPWLDGGVPQSRQVHRLRPLLRAAGETCGGAGGRKRECHSPSSQNHPWQNICALILSRRCQQLLWRVHGGGGLRRQGHHQGAIWIKGQRRLQAGCSPFCSGIQPNPNHVPEHILYHEEWWLCLPLWTCSWRCEAAQPPHSS